MRLPLLLSSSRIVALLFSDARCRDTLDTSNRTGFPEIRNVKIARQFAVLSYSVWRLSSVSEISKTTQDIYEVSVQSQSLISLHIRDTRTNFHDRSMKRFAKLVVVLLQIFCIQFLRNSIKQLKGCFARYWTNRFDKDY